MGTSFGRCSKPARRPARSLPPLVPGFLDFYANYRAAVLGAGRSEGDVAAVMCAIADRVLNQFRDPYTFPSAHTRITAPYDYYAFGQAYVRNLVDYSTSLVGHIERFDRIERQLAAGENVVLLANHQTEADPAVWALPAGGDPPPPRHRCRVCGGGSGGN